MYKCEIIADSKNPQGDRLTSFLVTYPRIVHAEMLRHRMFSRNVASSRAIPFAKMVKDVEENPFIPIAWQKKHKGMQGSEYITDLVKIEQARGLWLQSMEHSIKYAKFLSGSEERSNFRVTKQLCNRLLEPFVWTTELITGTEWDNFFELRCPSYQFDDGIFKSIKDVCNYIGNCVFVKMDGSTAILTSHNTTYQSTNLSQAEIHIQKIAEMMWDAYNESTPKQLKAGEWHISFGDNIDIEEWYNLNKRPSAPYYSELEPDEIDKYLVKIAAARCARLSYTTLGDNPKIDYKADIKLHDRLLEQKHMSPFEHCAKAMSDEEYASYVKGKLMVDSDDGYYTIEGPSMDEKLEGGWCRNFKGFIQYRHLIESL